MAMSAAEPYHCAGAPVFEAAQRLSWQMSWPMSRKCGGPSMSAPGTLTLPAPAKINLFLHVTGRRSDGYHTLETLLVPIDYGDRVTLALRAGPEIVRTRASPSSP